MNETSVGVRELKARLVKQFHPEQIIPQHCLAHTLNSRTGLV